MWSNVQELFLEMEKEEYVILRNYEEYPDSLIINGHEDIDLLCVDTQKMSKVMQAEAIEGSKVHFQIVVGGQTIPVDIRHVGDGYYDKNWEEDMLKKREKFNNFCYVMDRENYFFSLLYHVIVQKPFIKEDYVTRLQKMGKEIIVGFKGREDFVSVLNKFLQVNGYMATNTEDVQVFLNFNSILPERVMINKDWEKKRTRWERKEKIKSILKILRLHKY